MRKLAFTHIDLLLIFLVVFSNLLLIFAPLVEPRTAVFGFVLSIAVLCKVAFQSSKLTKEYIIPRMWILALIAIVFLYFRTSDFIRIHKMQKANLEIIENNQNQDARIPGYFISKRYSSLYADDFISDSKYVDNVMAAKYYGCASLAVDVAIKTDRQARWSRRAILLKNDSTFLDRFKELPLQTALLNGLELERIFFKIGNEHNPNLEWIIKTNRQERSDEFKLVTRGSKKSGIDFLKKMIPEKFRLSMLDYLDFDSLPFLMEDGQYYYNYISNIEDYDYLIISLYDPAQHSTVGQTFTIHTHSLLNAK